MQLRKIGQKIRDIRRFNQILRILTKHGFGFAIQQLHLERHVIGRGVIKIRMLKRFTEPQESRSVRLRKVLEELGPTFIKLGQILSVRPDLIPIDLCDELSKLQDQVPPFDYGDIKKQIKESLGSYPEELFSAFNSTPIAAASLGQAHQARLKTGEDVVVKVQRPDIRRTIETDIDILYTLAQLAGRYMADIKVFDPISIVNEFSKVITKEIDFTHEAHNIDKFCKNFKDSVTVRIPKVFWEYTRSKVITTEEIKGIRLNDYLNQPHSNEEKRTVALNGANAILQQIFVNGFFHADPHPGNIFILPDNVVAFVDFGIVGRLDEDSRDAIVSLLIAVSMKNARGIIKALESLGAFTEDVPIRSFKHDINDFMERYYDIPLKQIEISTVLQQAIDSMLRYKLKIP
ncbi:MAG TPA: ABC1 kinase family protein, partial [Candidatus Wujingus californicus]